VKNNWQSTIVALLFVVGTVTAIAAEPQLPAGTPVRNGVVTGILRTSNGLPLNEVRIAVTPIDSSVGFGALEGMGFTALTDSAGRYRLEKIASGRYNVLIGVNGPRFYYPGVADRGRAVMIQVTSGATTEVPDTVVPGGPVTGRVVAAGAGRRVETLVLCCDYFKQFQYPQKENGLKQGIPFIATISQDGSFVFPFVPAGNYALSLMDRHVIPVTWALAVGPNGVTALQLDVVEGVEVEGTVLDQIGKPVRADVRLVSKPAKSVTNTIGEPMNTGDRPQITENGTPQGVRTVLRRILVPKVDPSLDEIQDVMLEAARNRERSATPDRLGTPDPDGRFAIHNVFPGTYVLEVNSGGVILPEREIQVGTDGLANVSIQVPAIQVNGRVTAAGGGKLPKLNYIRVVRGESDADTFYGFPDSEGRFSLVLLPGQYRVFTESLGPAVQSVLNGSQDITNTELKVDSGLDSQIVVTVTDKLSGR
jgi:hypothetical protein